MKTILITGCTGFIGSHLTEYYCKKGFNVIGIDSKKVYAINRQIQFFQYDLENSDLTNFYKKLKPNYYIHCAGNANVGISLQYPELDFKKNVNILYRILSSLKRAECNPKFLFISSAAVYGNPINLPIKETEELKPISPYGLHKMICEDICKYFNYKENMNLIIIRIFSAYGEGLKKQILWDMYKKLKDRGKIELFGTGNETRDFINIRDIVQSIELILSSNSSAKIYNVANSEAISIKELAYKFVNNYGLDKSIVTFNGKLKEGDPLYWKADITPLKDIGYKKTISIDKGIALYVDWLRSLKNE